MLERILIAGSGGQGVILLGKMLARAALRDVQHITFFPAYGAEVRGGTSHCQVILSSDDIASPVADRFEAMVIMNQASLERFHSQAAENGLTFVNATLCDIPAGFSGYAVQATEEARRLGDQRAANFVMLGALLSQKPLVPPDHMEQSIRAFFLSKGAPLADLNAKALRLGMTLTGTT